MAKKKKKKIARGSGFSVSLPTENLAGAAKNVGVMAVQVQEDGVLVNGYDIPLGQSLEFRVGGSVQAAIKRSGPAPDTEIRLTANADNNESIIVEYEFALDPGALQKVVLPPGERMQMNAVLARDWLVTAPTWSNEDD